MTKIKLCGLARPCDIEMANQLKPDYIGFILAPQFWRYVPSETVAKLRTALDPAIQVVGVFVNQDVDEVARLLTEGIIDVAQLHGQEDEGYIAALRQRTDKPIFKAFRINSPEAVAAANASSADCVLLDSGTGTGKVFDWSLLEQIRRPYFLAGGLHPGNVEEAVRALQPYGVDVSSGIETEKRKDPEKMAAFVAAVKRGAEA